MKKGIYSLIFLMLTLCLISGCGKKAGETGDFSVQQVTQLLEQMSSSPLGVTFRAEPANIAVETGNKQHIITLKNPVITMNMAALKDLAPMAQSELFKNVQIPVKMAQLILIYNPSEEYLGIQGIEGLDFDWTFSEAGKSMSFKMTCQSMTFEKYNLSVLLDREKKDFMDTMTRFLRENGTNRGSARGFSYRFSLPLTETGMSVNFTIQEMDWTQEAETEFFMALFGKEGPKVDLAQLLVQGKPLFDMNGTLKNVNLTVKEGEKLLGGGMMTSTKMGYYLKPGADKSFFDYGFNWHLDGLTIDVPEKKAMELFGNINSMDMSFVFGHLTPGFVQAYVDIMKQSMKMTPGGSEDARQAQMQQGMQIIGELTKSQPTIAMSFSPLDHHFGRLEMDGKLQFKGVGAPTGMATARIKELDQVINKLKSNDLITPQVIQWIQGMFIKDAGGDGVLTFESKEGAPGAFYLNGKPVNM